MTDLDHTKSLMPYKAILESHEQEYRDAEGEERSKVINVISQEIMDEAQENGATIGDEDSLLKVCGKSVS